MTANINGFQFPASIEALLQKPIIDWEKLVQELEPHQWNLPPDARQILESRLVEKFEQKPFEFVVGLLPTQIEYSHVRFDFKRQIFRNLSTEGIQQVLHRIKNISSASGFKATCDFLLTNLALTEQDHDWFDTFLSLAFKRYNIQKDLPLFAKYFKLLREVGIEGWSEHVSYTRNHIEFFGKRKPEFFTEKSIDGTSVLDTNIVRYFQRFPCKTATALRKCEPLHEAFPLAYSSTNNKGSLLQHYFLAFDEQVYEDDRPEFLEQESALTLAENWCRSYWANCDTLPITVYPAGLCIPSPEYDLQAPVHLIIRRVAMILDSLVSAMKHRFEHRDTPPGYDYSSLTMGDVEETTERSFSEGRRVIEVMIGAAPQVLEYQCLKSKLFPFQALAAECSNVNGTVLEDNDAWVVGMCFDMLRKAPQVVSVGLTPDFTKHLQHPSFREGALLELEATRLEIRRDYEIAEIRSNAQRLYKSAISCESKKRKLNSIL